MKSSLRVIEAEPAYGRAYATGQEVMEHWVGGKDFKIWGGGPYFNIGDLEVMKRGGTKVVHIFYDAALAPVIIKL